MKYVCTSISFYKIFCGCAPPRLELATLELETQHATTTLPQQMLSCRAKIIIFLNDDLGIRKKILRNNAQRALRLKQRNFIIAMTSILLDLSIYPSKIEKTFFISMKCMTIFGSYELKLVTLKGRIRSIYENER